MAEQEKNYLDIEATAARVKKGIEEVVEALTNDILENNNKVFTLEVAEELNEESTEEDLLNGVKIRLKKVSAISPVEINEGEMPVGDGEDWLKKSHLYSSFFPTSNSSGAFTEIRFGPDMITEPNISYPDGTIGYDTSRFVICGNPLAIENKTSSSTNSDTRVKENDAKTFKMVIAETAKATFEDNSNFSVDSKGLHFAADNSNWGENRFTLTDGANMDVTGDVSGSPQVYIHGKCFLNLDRGYDPRYERYNYTGNNAVVPIEGATIAMHDKAMLAMSEGAYVAASDMAKVFFQGNSELYIQGGKMYMDGGTIALNARDHQYTPCIHMNGGGTILFNASEDTKTSIGSELDPALIASPNSFVLIGQGARGVGKRGGPQINGDVFGDLDMLTPSNCNPRIQIADETMIMIDAAKGDGANWIKIGADSGSLLQITLTGNIFQQMEHNAHSEMHDNSRFIMRGITNKKGWEEKNISYYKNGHLNQDWTRPVRSIENDSPVFGMYDTSQFTMRGVWDTEEEWKLETYGISIYWDASVDLPTSIEDLSEENKNKLFEYNDYRQVRDAKDADGNILTTFTLDDYGYLRISNYELSSKPEDWHEHLDKIENQPVVEIIENADVRIYGNSELKLTDYSIIANSEGFTFKDNAAGEEVSFSMSELKELKKLLVGATITE